MRGRDDVHTAPKKGQGTKNVCQGLVAFSCVANGVPSQRILRGMYLTINPSTTQHGVSFHPVHIPTAITPNR